jgi:hypothetical protein
MNKNRSLKKLREANEADMEPLLRISHSDGDAMVVLLQSQSGVYHVKEYSKYGSSTWSAWDLMTPNANVREAYRAINEAFGG